MDFEIQFEYLMNMEWERETQKTDFGLLGLNFHSGERVNLTVTHLRERLADDFEIRDDIIIPVGDYETLEMRAFFNTASRRMLSTRLEFTKGEFWSGDRTAYELNGTIKPGPGLSLSASYEHNDVTLQEGSFTTNLLRADARWQLSPWASFTSNLQWDDVSDIVGLFTRFRWILTPGSDLYIVYTHNWSDDQEDLLSRDRFETISRGATTKLSYTYRF
jgi:hypothetical protein